MTHEGEERRAPETFQASVSDLVVERLVRLAGDPQRLPEGATERVHRRVHGAWQARVRRRRRRQVLALAALLVASLGGSLVYVLAPSGTASPAATVHVADGGLWSGTRAIGEGDAVTPGSTLSTAGSPAALELATGASLRMNRDSRLRLLTDRELRLEKGAIYLDADAADQALVVRTPHGVVRDLGTQFELMLGSGELRVRVREGLVELRTGQLRHTAEAGVELRIDDLGQTQKRQVPRHGEPWQPYLQVAPTFVLEGSSLEDYFHWLRRETGWHLVFRDPEIRRKAGRVILHGSLDGLPVDATADFVLPTCGLEAELGDGVLEIFPARPAETPDPRSELR